MKQMFSILMCLVMLGLALGTGPAAQASETVEGAKKDYARFKQEMAVKLEAIEKRIADLKAQAKESGGAAQDKVIRESEATRDGLRAKMNQLSEDGKQGWKKLKSDMIETADSLNAKLKKALE